MVRFFDADREELIARRDRVWTAGELAARMAASLEAAGRDVPTYLTLAENELRDRDLERAVFAMHCFWKGEAVLGGHPGVFRTRAGWSSGREAVEVHFDPEMLPFGELVRLASSVQCADAVYATNPAQLEVARSIVGARAVSPDGSGTEVGDAKESDRKYHLRRSPLNHLPLTPLQAQRVNSALEEGSDPAEFLSPRQRELLQAVKRADPKVLSGLERPAGLAELGAYEDQLRARLGG